MSAIRLECVSRHWGATRAVHEVSFEAEEGSFVVLLGPSGCGKSTTLRLIAGLEAATSGRVFIGGKDVTNLPPSKRNISMVFQSYALFPHLSVAENVLFGLKVRNVPLAERNERLIETAQLLGLSDLLERKPSQLSGGQQQRVALGRAIISRAPVCLMDEPLSNLDAQLRHDMRREIRSLQRKLGVTMVYVTHDQTEAMSMADQVVLLRHGRIEQDGPPAELYRHPASAFAARFIGTPPMNLLTLEDGSEGQVVVGSSGPVVCSTRGANLQLGIRPEDIRLDRAGLAAKIVSVEYLGADSIVGCAVGDQTVIVRHPGQTGLRPGEQVSLTWSRESVHLFDGGSGAHRDDIAGAVSLAA